VGVLTDILVADRGDAGRISSAAAPLEHWRGIDAKGIDLVRLAMLTAVLNENDYDSACVGEFGLLAARDDADGPWVYAAPVPLVAALASLEPELVSRRAEEWFEFARDEFRSQGYRRADVRLLLTALTDLARSARAEGTDLLIWIAL
jgi:hypothetical protein